MARKIIKYVAIFVAVVFIINFIYYLHQNPGNVALIKLNGIINHESTRDWLKQIKKAKEARNFKSALIIINSPGGSANDSERLYRAIKELNEKKPVVVLVENICASGGYYAACGARQIVAYPTSVVGSIGVLFETINVSELSKRLGISSFVIKSGAVKDVGNPFRKPTPKDKKMLQAVVNGIFNEFLYTVAESRHLDVNKLRKHADGSVFSARQAKEIGLIDEVGGKKEAFKLIKNRAQINKIFLKELKPKKRFIKELLGERVNFVFDYFSLLLNPSVKAIFHD